MLDAGTSNNMEAIEDMVGEQVRLHAPEIAEALLLEADKHDLGAKLSGSVVLTEKVATSLNVAVDATVRTGEGLYEVSTIIGWHVDVRNELGTVFYGTLPTTMRVDIADAKIDTEPDYGRAELCVRDTAAGFVKERCSDG